MITMTNNIRSDFMKMTFGTASLIIGAALIGYGANIMADDPFNTLVVWTAAMVASIVGAVLIVWGDR